MDIRKIDSGLPLTAKIELLNDFIIQLQGLVQSGKFDVNELDQIFSDTSDTPRKFIRNVALGHTLSDYTDWSHVHAESGYSIWKLAPDSFTNSSLNQLYFDNKILENRGSASSESLSLFDSVFLYNGATTLFADNSTEAGTEGGTSFNLMDDTNDYLYLGGASVFSGATFEFDTRGANYTLVVQYWNGATWSTLDSNTNDLDDDTNNFLGDARISWSLPGDWATTSVNGQTKYWVRISTTTTPTTVAKPFLVVPTDSVIALLELSSDEFFKEQFAWCSYNGYIYVTIRNTGVTAYEGDAFISSSSTVTNLKNFFIYNHEFKLDYQNTTYVSQSVTYLKNGTVEIGDLVYVYDEDTIAAANAGDLTKFAVAICTDNTVGFIKIKNYGRVNSVNTIGEANIVAGDRLYLSNVSGKITKTLTESAYVFTQFIGVAITDESTSKVDVLLSINYNPFVI